MFNQYKYDVAHRKCRRKIGVGRLSLFTFTLTLTLHEMSLCAVTLCNALRLQSVQEFLRRSMSYARGLLTPVLVTLIGVGTGKQTLSPLASKEPPANLGPGIAIFDPAFKQEKEQRELGQCVLSYPIHTQNCPPATNQHSLQER